MQTRFQLAHSAVAPLLCILLSTIMAANVSDDALSCSGSDYSWDAEESEAHTRYWDNLNAECAKQWALAPSTDPPESIPDELFGTWLHAITKKIYMDPVWLEAQWEYVFSNDIFHKCDIDVNALAHHHQVAFVSSTQLSIAQQGYDAWITPRQAWVEKYNLVGMLENVAAS